MPTQKEEEKVWDAIADSWHSFRQRVNPKLALYLKKYADSWQPGKILDIGCGNCRNLMPFEYNYFDCYGVDFSEKMIKCAMEYGKKHQLKIKLKQAYATDLPFPEQYFNYILSVSVIHHLNEEERKKALKEIYRVLKYRGKAFIAVWNKLQPRFFFQKKDVLIPWHIKDKVYQRYYHLFTHREMKKLLVKTGFKILKSNIFGENLLFLVKK